MTPFRICNQFAIVIKRLVEGVSQRLSIWRRSIVLSPLEAVLQPSTARLRAVGTFICISQPLIGIAWSLSAPQPYENLWLRVLLGAMGVLLIWDKVSKTPDSPFAGKVATLVFWAELPLFGAWMYFCNGGNTEWLVSLCCMVLIYYHLTDWRIATGGVIAAGLVAWAAKQAFAIFLPVVPVPPYGSHAMLFLFCWFSAITLGASAANLRREHITNTFNAMMVFAQELRAPVATIGCIADKLESKAFRAEDQRSMLATADRLSTQLHGLVRSINNKFDTYVNNSGILRVGNPSQRVSAYEVLQEVVGAYPYQTPKQRLAVRLNVHKDFEFQSSFAQITQGLNNLLDNAFWALAQKYQDATGEGFIDLYVTASGSEGFIKITDNGAGIPDKFKDRVLEPFFTTHRATNLGLGLPYLERVVHLAGGHLAIESVYGAGTAVTLRLPRISRSRSTADNISEANRVTRTDSASTT
jgi:two-component system CAI-1 autoinducer sensor kinase/phosphatase CqsS